MIRFFATLNKNNNTKTYHKVNNDSNMELNPY